VIVATPPLFSSPFLSRLSHRITGRAASDATAAALPNVRLILGITLLLLGLGSLSCQVQDSVGDGPVSTPTGQWVRTVDGWERTELWNAPGLYVPRLHPLVVAAGEGLVSVLALVVCAEHGRNRRRASIAKQRTAF
jgi:hypothetical protein